MIETSKAGLQRSASFLFPEPPSQGRRFSDPLLALSAAGPPAPAAADLAPPTLPATTEKSPIAGVPASGAQTGLDQNNAPDPKNASFQTSVAIPSNPPVALDSHTLLSDSFAAASASGTGSSGGGCGCGACKTLTVTGNDGAPAWDTTGQAPVVMDSVVTLGTGVNLSNVFRLHSNPTATKTIFLDFDGFSISSTPWENGGALSLKSFYSTFDTTALTEIQRIWQRVAEDFAPFNVNVTTEDPGSENLRKFGTGDERWGIRVAFTSNLNLLTGQAIKNAGGGGTAYYNSFNWSTDDVALVFNRGEYTASQTASHEVGHTLGLTHDGSSTTEYYAGHGGTGPTSWGAIMGASWQGNDENLTQWSRGQYLGANNTQDDLAVITGGNGFTYRADDHGSTFSTATALTGTSFSSFGIIERNTDLDLFRFDTGDGLVTFNIVNASRAFINNSGLYSSEYLAARGANLDISATLYRADYSVVQVFNPADLTTASFSLNLSAGRYFLGIDGVGMGDPFAATPTGYTDYASLGQYMLSGTVQAPAATFTPPPPPPAPTLVVTGADNLVTTEAGGTASFQVALSGAPTSDVTVRLSSTDTTEGALRTTTLVFTAANWQTPQTVTVQGVDDTLVDGIQNWGVVMSTSSADPAFQGLTGPLVTVQNSDNDVATTTTTTTRTTSPVTFLANSGGIFANVSYNQAPTVVGSLAAINTSDNQRLAITEGAQQTSKGMAIQLNEYRWTFQNLDRVTQMVFEGYRNASANDSFRIQYSPSGNSWTTAFTISNATEQTFTFNLPSAVSGTMHVRAVDTQANTRDKTYDTLFVDRLVFVGNGAAPRGPIDPIIGGSQRAPEEALETDHDSLFDFAPPGGELAEEPVLGFEPLAALPADMTESPFSASGPDTSATSPWLVSVQPLV